MSAFKDMVEADIVNVFLNLDELAEIHNLDGVECACVISSDKTDDRVTASTASREPQMACMVII